MVRINLLKKATRKKVPVKIPIPGKTLILLIIASAAIAGGVYFWHKIPKSAPVVTQDRVQSDYTPSTHAKSRIIEDVVRELSDQSSQSGRKGVLEIPYKEMSFAERINYEVLFGKNVFEMLSRAVPEGIGLKNLETENFQTIYAVGLGGEKELIVSTFSALKLERLELLQKPYSYITSNAGNGYRFVVTCKAEFGLDLADPFQAIENLPTKDDLSIIIKRISQIALQNDVKLKSEPQQVSAERVGAYRRYLFNISGKCAYKDFVRLVLQLHKERIPCAFKKVKIKARTGMVTEVESDILITFKE